MKGIISNKIIEESVEEHGKRLDDLMLNNQVVITVTDEKTQESITINGNVSISFKGKPIGTEFIYHPLKFYELLSDNRREGRFKESDYYQI